MDGESFQKVDREHRESVRSWYHPGGGLQRERVKGRAEHQYLVDDTGIGPTEGGDRITERG